MLRFSATRCTKRAALFTAESVRTKASKLLFIMTYALYTSVSTTIFRLFKCQNVQGRWYLTADYRLRCFEGVWYLYASLAIAGIAVYTIGIPLMLFVVLRRNRRYLYESTCPRDQMHRHAEVKRRLGAVYSDYNPNAYYFDLVDMLRRLLLTGGLIILGESSNTQIFLGALICMAWVRRCRGRQLVFRRAGLGFAADRISFPFGNAHGMPKQGFSVRGSTPPTAGMADRALCRRSRRGCCRQQA